jgi:peptidoglycan hydrolase-like protein with peptidoglycan-binding domain
VVSRGGVLFRVDNNPVRLLYGTLPAYRPFVSGMSNGPDVKQLEQNLVALGMDPDHQITVDTHFSTATGAAIRRWQAHTGVPYTQRTSRLDQGQVQFLPGALRAGNVRPAIGAGVAPNQTVLTGSSTEHVVTVALPTDQQRLVKPGNQVQVQVSGVDPVKGRVLSVGKVATAPARTAGDPQSQPATVTITISATLPKGSPDLDQSPVQVGIITDTHKNVLMVPVTALQARPGGGYQVHLGTGQYVQVEPGLFDSSAGTVEVTGSVTEGQTVEVPAQ